MSNYVYNTPQMLLATQVAYLDIPEGMSVGKYVEYLMTLKDSKNLKGKLKKQCEVLNDFMSIVEKSNYQDWKSWKVVNRCDKNNQSGMYGCLIDTGYGDAIIGFRGSESVSGSQVIKDWVVSDAGMYMSVLTQQQKDASDYVRNIWNKYGKKYSTYSITGHSLGGNLAEHATITAPKEMVDHIDHTVSFDGPGYSQLYLKAHKKEIERAGGKVTHLEWSFVGGMLSQPSNIEDKVIQAQNPDMEGSVLGIQKAELWRHATSSVVLGDNDVVVTKERTAFAQTTHNITVTLESGSALWLLSHIPFVRNVIFANTISSYIRQLRDKVERTIADVRETFKNMTNALYQKYFAPRVSGDFMINVSAVPALCSEFVAVQDKFNRITENVENIRRTLRYNSISGAYLKTKLFCMCNRMNREARKIKKYADVLGEIRQIYVNADNEVSDLYI